jgi:hypothetical protein
MSALTDRLSEANLRELARLIRETHARAAAKRERLAREQGEPPRGDGDHDAP